jgi:hypothetical protein
MPIKAKLRKLMDKEIYYVEFHKEIIEQNGRKQVQSKTTNLPNMASSVQP